MVAALPTKRVLGDAELLRDVVVERGIAGKTALILGADELLGRVVGVDLEAV